MAVLVLLLYALHQDVWFWLSSQPLVFGFLPPGLFYHVCYCLAAAALMLLLVRAVWPAHLDQDDERNEDTSR